jgi:PAS domain S-box-containing protein
METTEQGFLGRKLSDFDRRIDELVAQLQHSPETPMKSLVQQLLAELETGREELHVMEEELAARERALTKADAKAQAERQRYLDLFHCAPDPYLVTDSDGTIEEANEAASKLLRVPQHKTLGQPLNAFLAEAERRPFYNYLFRAKNQKATETGRAEWRSSLQPRDGPSVPVFVACNTVFEGDGNKVQWIFRDVSALREAEAAEQAAHRALESRVEERTTELEKLNRELQEKVAELEQFHDVVVGRELRMIELEKQHKVLEDKIKHLEELESPH